MDKSLAAPDGPIDLIYLAKQTLGDEHLQRELLEIFLERSPPLLAGILELDPSESGAFRDLVHRLKGSARAIGAIRIASIAEAIEQCRPDESRQILLTALAAALEDCLAAIARRQKPESSSAVFDPPNS
jgi:HPt (histidine-containing phosphotransfer) domain-containing protein